MEYLLTLLLSLSFSPGQASHLPATHQPAPIEVSIADTSPASPYDDLIAQHSATHGVDPDLVRAVMVTESSFRPNAESPAGAQGLMQLIPSTAKRFGVENSMDPDENIEGGVKYLKFLLETFDNDVKLTLAGYNAGEGAVKRHGGIPPYRETINYVEKITAIYGTTYQAPDAVFAAD